MKKHILITGSHRSGSTWTGKVLSQAENVRYIFEPFNIDFRKDTPVKYWFNYVSGKSKLEKDEIKEYLKSFYSPLQKSLVKNALIKGKNNSRKENLKEIIKRATNTFLFKDPLALLAAEWIYKEFDWKILVLIRHPAAFIASIKEKNWTFDFNHFLNQDVLMETLLHPFKKDIIEYSSNEKDIISQGILLWNCLHYIISLYHKDYRDEWLFIKHEDLSLAPEKEFKYIFETFHLPYTPHVKEYIVQTTTAKTNTNLERNSRNNIKAWKNKLSENDIEKIKKETKSVWVKFYNEDDW